MQQNAKIITMKTSSNFSTNIYIDTYIYKNGYAMIILFEAEQQEI